MKPNPIYLKAAKGEYISGADLAKLIKGALTRSFPKTKFSVTSGSGSVDARWMDGPTVEHANEIARTYKTQGFDGMIDLAHSNSLWLYPDGTAHVAHDEGTRGSGGYHSERIESPRRPDAVLVSNVSSVYVFCSRHITAPAYVRAIEETKAKNFTELENFDWSTLTIEKHVYDGSAYLKGGDFVGIHGTWLSSYIGQKAHGYDLTDLAPVAVAPKQEALAPAVAPYVPNLCW